MRVLHWKKSQFFLTAMVMGLFTLSSMSVHAQELPIKLPELNLPRPSDEQPNDGDEQQQLAPIQNESTQTEPAQTEPTKTEGVTTEAVKPEEVQPEALQPEAAKSDVSPEEKQPVMMEENAASSQKDNEKQDGQSEEPAAQTKEQTNAVPTDVKPDVQVTPPYNAPENTDLPSTQVVPVIKDEGAQKTVQENNQEVPLEADKVNNDKIISPKTDDASKPISTESQKSENLAVEPNEDAQTEYSSLEDPIDDENNPVVAMIDAIVRQRDPALKIDAPRSDIFRFVSVERKGSTLLYHAAAPSLVTSPQWDGLTMTTIMCKEKSLRPYILDGKAAIKIEMNVVSPAGDYTFVANAQSCKQLTPEDENLNQAIEEPDFIALALAAEAQRLSLFGCLKNSSTEMLENCTLGMVPRTSWEWQLQDVKTDQRKVMMTYLNVGEAVDDQEIRRVINRTCAKEEIHAIIQLGVVYDINVSGKANKEFLIDKQACDQL